MDMDNAGAKPEASAPSRLGDALERIRRLERTGRLDAAAAACREVLQHDARNADVWFTLSGIEQQRQRSDAALEAIDHALACDEVNAPALCRRGSLLRVLGRTEDAIESHRRAIAADQSYAEAHNNLGNCLRDLRRFEEAEEQYRQAVALRPTYAQAHNNLGVTLRELDRDDDAVKSLFRALTLAPDYANAQLNLGMVLLKQQKLVEAEGLLRRAVSGAPHDGAAHLHLASALLQMDRSDEAGPILQRAVELVPGNAEAEFDLGLVLLAQGRFREGWKHYEARWRLTDDPKSPRPKQFRPSVMPWNGERLEGKAILVQSEQGLGDTIQFSRYVPMLASRGAKVTFLVQLPLLRLLAPIAAVADVTARVEHSRLLHYRSTLIGLPRAFETEVGSIPRADGPYLFAEPERTAAWRERIGTHGFKIAICWQGTPNTRVDRGRSIPVSAFLPLAAQPGVRLISVQKGHGLDQLPNLPTWMQVETLGPDFDAGPDAFLDTAAVMANCDLVVTSDTSVAHLAGALDRPTWLALSTTAEWRWLRDRRDSPWYRSMTLFRQSKPGDWSTVFAEMAEALGGLLRGKA